LNTALATTKIAVPLAFATGSFTDWNTGLGVYNVGGSGTITTTWVVANTAPVESYQFAKPGTAGEVTQFGAAQLTDEGLPKTFVGSVFVETDGHSIMALINNTRYLDGWASTMVGYNYP
jgi:hypothetical protein